MVNVKPVHLQKCSNELFSIDEVLEMPNLIEVQKKLLQMVS